jgi:hypothetical protein
MFADPLCWCFFGICSSQGIEEIDGSVVAYDDVKAWIPCVDSVCEGSLIVRINQRNQPEYVRVNLKYREGKFPKSSLSGRGLGD